MGYMLGWLISFYRKKDNQQSSATKDSAIGKQIATWQTGLNGIEWIDKLVTESKAIAIGGDGYPFLYTSTTRHIISIIVDGPPSANKVWNYDEHSLITEGWKGRTIIDYEEIKHLQADEWLIIEVFDES